MEQESELRSVISLILGAGYQIDKDAFEFLKEASHTADVNLLITKVMEDISKLPEKPLFVSREILDRKLKELQPTYQHRTASGEAGKGGFQPYASEVEPDIEVLEDPTREISAAGTLEGYIEYFQDRFQKLRRIMNGRVDARDAGTISDVLKAPTNSKAKIICMISERRESKRGIFLRVEDTEANATVFVPSEPREMFQKAQRLMLDQVACICAVVGRNGLLIAEDIIFPDVPLKKPNRAPIPVYAALISDLHVGSKMFMKDSFRRFMDWLKGNADNARLREIASHVKYLVIAGDIVDGVGIYPEQAKELAIRDIYRQYRAAAEIIEHVPSYIEVIMIPGNHDACRRALPQPAIPKEYAEPIYEAREIHSLGSPSTLRLHGVTILLDHGRSLDDVVSIVPKMSFQFPDEAMKFLLQCRHVAPVYGSRTLIASEKADHLVIERVPDIFHAGHVHMMSYSAYRGTLLVNSGAWQEQTEYQREMGHTPNPGIVPIVDLQTLQVIPLNFASAL